MPILEINAISKRFPGVQALLDVSFSVEEGSIHAVLGENGAGKSTLMQILAGALQPDSGSLVFGSHTVRFANPRQAQEAGIAIVYQELNLAPNLTVAENIFLGSEPRSGRIFLAKGHLEADALGILSRLGIAIHPETLVRTLTVAQQQLIEICKSLVRSPRLLIFDEPTASLSEAESAILFRVIADLKRRGVTMLYISHRLPEVFAISDHITVLRDGRHVRTAPTSSVSQGEVVRLMVGRELSQAQKQRPRHDTAQAREKVLEVRGLSRTGQYREVSFSVQRGEIVGMAGLVGAGRSEVALGIFGAPPPEEGEVFMEGQRSRIRSPQDAMAAGIALVPEDRKDMGLVLGLSVGENASLASLDKVSSAGFIRRRAEQELVSGFVRRFRVRTPSLVQPVGNLSGGNQQKVVLAKWLAARPKLLIVDEPTRGVDVGTKAELYTLLDELSAEGLAILVISSDLPEILTVSDRVLVMREGELVGELSREEASEERIMALAALGDRINYLFG